MSSVIDVVWCSE